MAKTLNLQSGSEKFVLRNVSSQPGLQNLLFGTDYPFDPRKLLEWKGNRYSHLPDKIWQFETEIMKEFKYVYVVTDTPELKLYITIPYISSKDEEFNTIWKLQSLWRMFHIDSDYDKYAQEWQGCSDINLPAGSLTPDYAVVGIAPGNNWKNPLIRNNPVGVAGRTLCYGSTSFLIRETIFQFSQDVWFTNISKSIILENRNDKLQGEYLDVCISLLQKELSILNPQKIICLGNQVYDILLQRGFKNCVKIFHPAFLIRKNLGKDWYKTHITERLADL